MNNVNSARGVYVGVVVVALANVGTTWAQSDELPRRLRERITRTMVDDGFPSAVAAFDTEVKITASDGATSDRFGWSVSISGDTAIVGAYLDDDNETDIGSAYVYQRGQGGVDHWGQVTKITAGDGATGDWFGYSVAISGDMVIVGAVRDDENGLNSGSAYVYRRDQGGVDHWGQVAKITASDAESGDAFGWSVAISSDMAIVGAILGDDIGSNSGSAYVYRRDQGGVDNWGQVTKITAGDGVGNDQFGRSVAISGDTAIVGAFRNDDDGTDSGSAYVYQRNEAGVDNWGMVTKITASDAVGQDHFGWSVAIHGDTAILAAVLDDDNGSSSGSVYVYRRDEGGVDRWAQVTKITASDGAAGDEFGSSVAISGDMVIVGAHRDDDNVSNSGSAYVYRRDEGGIDNWGPVTKITASDAGSGDAFGWSVAISGETAIVGAILGDGNGSNSGSAYVFHAPECGNGVVVTGEECDDAGESPTCDVDCTLVECGDGTVNGSAGEECDDGGESPTCNVDCTVAECGDGMVNDSAGEECDDGAGNADNTPDTCRTDCTLPKCGDGVVDTGEACDDGNTFEADFCFSTCLRNPNPIPTVSEWGMVAMALLILTAGTIVYMRRHPAAE